MSTSVTNFLIVLGIIFGLIGLFAIVYLIITMRNVNRFVLLLEKEMTPILYGLKNTLDKISDELDKTVDIIDDVHKVSEKVNATVQLIQELFASPFIKLAGLSAGARKAFESLSHRGQEKVDTKKNIGQED